MRTLMIASILGLCLVASVDKAYAILITFDSDPVGLFVGDEYAAQGILFRSSDPLLSLEIASVGSRTTSAPNMLDPNHTPDGPDIIVEFVSPSDITVKATTNFFQVTLFDVDLAGNGLQAFDIEGNLLGQAISTCAGDFNCPNNSINEIISVNFPNMHRIFIATRGQLDGVNPNPDIGIDDVVFNAVTIPVPEPTTFFIFAFGIVGLGVMRRRKKVAGVSFQ